MSKIEELLEDTYCGSDEDYRLIIDGDKTKGIPSLIEYILEETQGEKELSKEKAYDAILTAMSYYIDDYPCTTCFRQQIWNQFYWWFQRMESGYDDEQIKEIMPEPIVYDMEIEMIKDLHFAKPGVSKKRLATKYHVSERTVKEMLNKLDRKEKGELRIAGQKIDMNLKHNDIHEYYDGRVGGNRYRYFAAASTINPVFLQFNIAQIHSLINGLKCSYYQEERELSVMSAIEIWSQLSEYTQNRIKFVYASKDEDLADFITLVESEMNSSYLHVYHSEHDLLEEGDLSDFEIDEINRKLAF